MISIYYILSSCYIFAYLIYVIHASEHGFIDKDKLNLSKAKSFTLSSIEDVEMLTYFLLWKHDYFDNSPDLNSVQSKFRR